MQSWITGILLIAAAQGIFLSIALLWRRRTQPASRVFLGLIILVLSLELLNAWGMQVRYHASDGALPFWLLGSYLLIPPSGWFFIRSNTAPGFAFERRHLLYYLPAAIELVAESILYFYNLEAVRPFSLLALPAWWLFTEIFPVLWMGGVLIMGGRRLAAQARGEATSASFAGLHPAKLLTVFILLCLLTVLWVADAVLQLPVFAALAFLLVLLLCTVSFGLYAQSSFFDITKMAKPRASAAPVFTAHNDAAELLRLQQAFEAGGLHRKAKLTLEEVAAELRLPVRYVSYLINTYHAGNFHRFINAYRVQEVIRKINDPAERHKTILALALEAGFSSKSSFNQVFKAHTGRTPSQYLVQ